MRGFLAAVVVCVIAVGCGSSAPKSASSRSSLTGRTWVSTSAAENGKPKALVPGTHITLKFSAKGELSADAGCNGMGGPVTFSGDKVIIHEFSMTAMGCPGGRNEQDEWVQAFMMSRPTWSVDNDHLTLANATTRIDFAVQVPERNRPLAGTHWSIEGVEHAETAEHRSVTNAYLEFNGTTFRGSTGCNTVTGSVAVTASTLEFSNVHFTLLACPSGAYDDVLHEVLTGTADYSIAGRDLRISKNMGLTLDLTAQ